jgi:hypothetical protein
LLHLSAIIPPPPYTTPAQEHTAEIQEEGKRWRGWGKEVRRHMDRELGSYRCIEGKIGMIIFK